MALFYHASEMRKKIASAVAGRLAGSYSAFGRFGRRYLVKFRFKEFFSCSYVKQLHSGKKKRERERIRTQGG